MKIKFDLCSRFSCFIVPYHRGIRSVQKFIKSERIIPYESKRNVEEEKKINKFTAQKYQIYSVSIIYAVYCRKAIKNFFSFIFPNTFTSNHKVSDIFMKLFMNENCYALRNSFSSLHFEPLLYPHITWHMKISWNVSLSSEVGVMFWNESWKWYGNQLLSILKWLRWFST